MANTIPRDLRSLSARFKEKTCEFRETALSLQVEKIESLAQQWMHTTCSTDEEKIVCLQEIMAEITRTFHQPDDRAISVFRILFEIRRIPLERLQRQSEEDRYSFSSVSACKGG